MDLRGPASRTGETDRDRHHSTVEPVVPEAAHVLWRAAILALFTCGDAEAGATRAWLSTGHGGRGQTWRIAPFGAFSPSSQPGEAMKCRNRILVFQHHRGQDEPNS